MTDTISAAADDLRQQICEKVDRIKGDPAMGEIVKMQAALNGLEDFLNRPRTTLGALFGLDGGAAIAPMAAMQPDEFVNLPALDAAKRFLRKVGKPARPFSDIVRGVRSGGGVVNYEDKLRTQLVRSNDVKKVADDLFGLAEWYPARKGRPPAEGGSKAVRPASLADLNDDGEDEHEEVESPNAENAPPADNE
jgi:hypothetical protein